MRHKVFYSKGVPPWAIRSDNGTELLAEEIDARGVSFVFRYSRMEEPKAWLEFEGTAIFMDGRATLKA